MAKAIRVVVLSCAVLAGLVPAARAQGPQAKLRALLTLEPREPGPQDSELRKLLVAKRNEAVAELKLVGQQIGTQVAITNPVLTDLARRVVDAELELARGPAERIAVLEKNLDFHKGLEDWVEQMVKGGNARQEAVHWARHHRFDAEARLLRERLPADKRQP